MTRLDSRDLVMSMTLAEIFILLVLVLWWGSALEAQGDGSPTVAIAVLNGQLADLRAEHDKLRADRDRANRELEEALGRLEAVRAMLGARDTSLRAFGEGLGSQLAVAKETGKRGRPKCVDANTLIQVNADGTLTATLVTGDAKTLAELRTLGANTGDRDSVLDRSDLERLLGAVSEYYRHHNDCRFDYRLQYRSTADYHDARQWLERVFYPERVVRLAN